MKELKTDRIQIKIEPTLKILAQKKAEDQGRTLSNYICELIRKDVEMMKLYTADTQTGTFIEEVKSIEEGKKLIEQYEVDDKAEGTYEEGFYNIVNENHETIWN